MKRYIKTSNYDTIEIDPELSSKQQQFMDLNIEVLTDPKVWSDSPIKVGETVDEDGEVFNVYDICKSSIDTFFEDYKKIPKDDWSSEVLQAERTFYRKYLDFAKKCKEVYDAYPRASGYGRYDSIKLKIQNGLKSVEYNFPYGWKNL